MNGKHKEFALYEILPFVLGGFFCLFLYQVTLSMVSKFNAPIWNVSVDIEDVHEGETIMVRYHPQPSQRLKGRWLVRVFREGQIDEPTCRGGGSGVYIPTYGVRYWDLGRYSGDPLCDTLPSGTYEIITIWDLYNESGRRILSWNELTFEVLPK